jgi:hypothetical protein
MLTVAPAYSNVMVNNVHVKTESGVVSKHNFGNKELHSKMGRALSCYVFQQFILLTFTSQTNMKSFFLFFFPHPSKVLLSNVGQLSFSIISSANKSSSSFIYLNCGDLLLNGSFPFTKAVSTTVQCIPFSSGYLLFPNKLLKKYFPLTRNFDSWFQTAQPPLYVWDAIFQNGSVSVTDGRNWNFILPKFGIWLCYLRWCVCFHSCSF